MKLWACTSVPSVNFWPFLSLTVRFCASSTVIDSAMSFCGAPLAS